MIPYGRQTIDQADIDAVTAVLQSDFLTQGPAVPAFEQAVAQYVGARHAVAVNSATSALHIACLALGLGEGDVLWTTPNTFVASSNCALYCGARVDFVDIDPLTYNLSPTALEDKLMQTQNQGNTLPKIVVGVDFAGQPCDWVRLRALADQYGFALIDDASHAIGAELNGIKLGGGHWADITIFSFHPVKIITTGEGGMALTQSQELAQKMQLLRSHGITRDLHLLEGKKVGAWHYEQQILGFNYRMTDIQAALGLSQLQHLEDWLARRRQLATQYDTWFSELPIITPSLVSEVKSAWHLYVIQIKSATLDMTRKEVFSALRAEGIGVNVHYMPVYLQPYYQKLGFAQGLCPVAEDYYHHAISIPMYAGLTDEQQAEVIEVLTGILA